MPQEHGKDMETGLGLAERSTSLLPRSQVRCSQCNMDVSRSVSFKLKVVTYKFSNGKAVYSLEGFQNLKAPGDKDILDNRPNSPDIEMRKIN